MNSATRRSFLARLGAIALLFVFSGCATSDLVTRAVIKDLRTSITKAGSDEARQADRWVDLHIPYHHSLLAGVAQLPEGPLILFTSGYQELLSNIAEVSVATKDNDAKRNRCRARYTERLGEDWLNVLSRSGGHPLRQGTNPKWATNPSEYFSQTKFTECKPLAKALPLAQQDHQLRDDMVARAVKFIYLHEIGHIVMGKTPSRLSRSSIAKLTGQEKDDALTERREREYEADLLAAKEYIRIHPDPMQMFNSPLFADSFQVYGAWDCKQERKRTHPAGDRRTARVMQYFLDNVVKAGKPDASKRVKRYMLNRIKLTKLRVDSADCSKV